MTKSIYVAATSQHVGKTTSTLGLVSMFMDHGVKVGYCKPVGQKFLDIDNLRVDKDAILFSDLIDFDLNPDIHSPIILGKGATKEILDNPTTLDLDKKLHKAKLALTSRNDVVVYEGTGHPGVGSVGNVSNAQVAKLLNASVVMVVEGGIGSTIDMLNMCMSLFREEGVPIKGVIINKVKVNKIDLVTEYVGKWLKMHNYPLLGVIPYDQTLAYPLIKTISTEVNGTIIYNASGANNRVENILAGSLIDLKELKSSQDLLLVVSTRSINHAIEKINSITEANGIKINPLSGIVATGHGFIDSNTISYIEKNKIPLIRTDLDTYGTVLRISKIEVKINRSTPWKVTRAIKLIKDNVDWELLN